MRSGTSVPAAKSKRKAQAQPTLPQHQLPLPYSRLMTLGYGDFEKAYEEVAAELRKGGASEAASRLVEIVLDEAYYAYDDPQYGRRMGGDPRSWTCLHALRVLSLMGEAARAGIEALTDVIGHEDDYLRE